MVSESEKINSDKNQNNSSEERYNRNRKSIEIFSIVSLFLLIGAILLITINQRLLAGCLVIAGASMGVIIVRKVLTLNESIKSSLIESSSLNVKKDSFITDFSHRIREPLNNLVIIVDMLLESGLEPKQKELLETFMASTNNMVSTVNELSMQSSGTAIYYTRKAIKFNVLTTITNTIELYSLKNNANIEFIVDKKEPFEYECFGDPIILKQIFLDLFNTIENNVTDKAIKVLITLKKTKVTAKESIILFRLQTDERITIIDSSGIESGLAARFIESGKGSYNQEIGENSTILNILLPFDNPVSEPKQQSGSQKIDELIQKDKTIKGLKDLNVLLVEDNLINQKITLLTLSPLVKNIDTASNGKEALDKFGTANYDLILMDIQMPVMNGLVATEKIRALESTTNSHIPIIAITANAMIGDKESCMSAGMDDYISKPFQPSRLIEKIKAII